MFEYFKNKLYQLSMIILTVETFVWVYSSNSVHSLGKSVHSFCKQAILIVFWSKKFTLGFFHLIFCIL